MPDHSSRESKNCLTVGQPVVLSGGLSSLPVHQGRQLSLNLHRRTQCCRRDSRAFTYP